MDELTKKLVSTVKTVTENYRGNMSSTAWTTGGGVYPRSWKDPSPDQTGTMRADLEARADARRSGTPLPPKPDRRMDDVEAARLRGSGEQAARDTEGDRGYDNAEAARARRVDTFGTPRSLPSSSLNENSGRKTFSQYLAEAGVRRKMRLVKGLQNKALRAGEAAPRGQSSSEEEAAHRQLKWAEQDLGREQARRTPRVLKRATQMAQLMHPPVPPGSGIYAHVERLEDVGQSAANYANQMAGGEKPGFVKRKPYFVTRYTEPRGGNDGY
jgi:hypothetical protein